MKEGAQSLVTASIMAQQTQARTSNGQLTSSGGAGGYLMANSISQGADITPSFQNTGVPSGNVSGGGPMTFEPGSLM